MTITLAQSRYPLQTVFKGDEVVILTKKQADEINTIFDFQKNRLAQLEQEVSNLKHQIDSIQLSHITQLTQANTEIRVAKMQLDSVNRFWYQVAIDGGWIYYSYRDRTIKITDLTYYHVRLDEELGDLLFINAPEDCRPADYVEQQRKNRESPPLQWERRIDPAIRPRVITIPTNLDMNK